MERLTQRLVIDAQVTRHRVDPESLRCLGAFDSLLDFVKEGQHRAGISRIALGHLVCKEKACGRVRRDARLTPKLRGAIALAFENRRDGEIVGLDEFTVTEFFALGELAAPVKSEAE